VAYVDRRRSGSRYRDGYRDLAWEEARLTDAPRVDGDFGYYERLTQWQRSGSFDRDADQAGLQPERDPATFNGSIWARARGIFGVGEPEDPQAPGYGAALDYYTERAYGDPFLWDWGAGPDAMQRYGALIRRSDERFREATVVLGALFANHLIAAADAFVSARGLAISVVPDAAGRNAPLAIRIRWGGER
jgi:hypothetical protein